ncbi:DUF2000 domain-containing protein [Dethiosulfatarculus sandiegensis]|uniref:DUF2000 domain-containing protein n=1 Tax=Dethiosulfatarculus sandiegensis TaxID=1429043 RepID=A0A0D2GIP9_9BACT|nr:DUF2000 domain-containing protein [Dethiosulfatarculus sandiegensis]KIX14692.1 hypothetical protein X474_07435 [Dethiosulfatarculus sandiegensis]
MKIVMLVNKKLPVGLATNTAAVLGISLGKAKKEIIGADLKDGSDIVHKGITSESIPILGADSQTLKQIYDKAIANNQVEVIDFSQLAQRCRDYKDYSQRLSQTRNQDLELSGLCLCGPKKDIQKLTGSLGLYH